MQLMEHQVEGKRFLLAHGVLLAFDMGLGKSRTAIAAAAELPGGLPVLVACPSVAIGVWQSEVTKVLPDTRVLWLHSRNLGELLKPWDYIVVSFDLTARNAEVHAALRALYFKVLIIDEVHGMADEDTQRTQSWLGHTNSLASRAHRVWGLSGTPTPNHAGNLFPLLAATAPGRIVKTPTRRTFEERFCTHKMVTLGGVERRVVKGTNLTRVKELRSLLAGWWLRAKTTDVFKDMPPLFTRFVPLAADKLPASLASFDSSTEGRRIREAIENGNFGSYAVGDDDSLSRYRKLLAQAKVPSAVEYTRYVLDSGARAVILWFWHSEAMDMAAERMRSYSVPFVRVDGSTNKAARDAAVASFQKADGPRVFLGQIKAAGVAITLTRATHNIFAEASWNPADNEQAMKRAHRIGQDRPVQADFLIVKGSLDEAVMAVAERKQAQSDALEGQKNGN